MDNLQIRANAQPITRHCRFGPRKLNHDTGGEYPIKEKISSKGEPPARSYGNPWQTSRNGVKKIGTNGCERSS